MSPILHVNFLSKLYSGSISDKEIVKASGFLEKLQSGDAVMAGKGFNIQDYLALRETVLIAPPVMRKKIMFLHLHQLLQGVLQLQGFILSVSLSM